MSGIATKLVNTTKGIFNSISGLVLKGVFNYPVITLVTIGAAVAGGIHAAESADDHLDGKTTMFNSLQNNHYRESLALQSVFTQFAALSMGLMYGVDGPDAFKGLARFNYVLLLILVIIWVVYIFTDDDKDLRTTVTSLTTAFSGITSICAGILSVRYFNKEESSGPLAEESNFADSMWTKGPLMPLFTRGFSLLYLVSTVVYIVYGQILENTEEAYTRDPTFANDLEKDLLHKEDQWKNLMFISSLFVLFILGLVVSMVKNIQGSKRDADRHFRALLFVALVWIAVVVLECYTAFNYHDDSWSNANFWNSVTHLVFAAIIAIAVNDNALRSGEEYGFTKNTANSATSGHAYKLMGGYF